MVNGQSALANSRLSGYCLELFLKFVDYLNCNGCLGKIVEPAVALVTYKHLKNLFNHLLERSQTT